MAAIPLNLVKLDQSPIFQQLQWEEALLRTDNQNWCLINRGTTTPTIILGISGDPSLLIDRSKMEKNSIPIIRRFSGGGAVVVDKNTLFITFICQSSAFDIPPYPQHLMEWSAQFYQPLFQSHCFQLRENDYTIGERKWGGNAQAIIKNRWLHHSSLLWDYDCHLMDYLLLPVKMPAYRQKRKHEEFLCRLSDYWGEQKAFEDDFIKQLETRFAITLVSTKELTKVADLPHRQITQFLSY